MRVSASVRESARECEDPLANLHRKKSRKRDKQKKNKNAMAEKAEETTSAEMYEHVLTSLAAPNSIVTMQRHLLRLAADGVGVIPALFQQDCEFNWSLLRRFQYKAIKTVLEYFKSDTPETFRDFTPDTEEEEGQDADEEEEEEEEDKQKNKEKNKKKKQKKEKKEKKDDENEEEKPTIPLCRAALIDPVPVTERRQCKLSIPCGGGKTAIISLLAALHGGSTLIITNNFENACQVLRTIIEKTNIAKFTPVRLLKSGIVAKSCTTKSLSETEKKFLMSQSQIKGYCDRELEHILPNGGSSGIIITDINMFKDAANSSIDTTSLREQLLRSLFNFVIFDESDAVFTTSVREVFEYGLVAKDPLRGDTLVPFRYEHLLLLSGTDERNNDEVGNAFLDRIRPLLYKVKSKEVEEEGYISKLTIVSVDCSTPSLEMSKQCETHIENVKNSSSDIRAVPPEKLRVLERIVAVHAIYAHQIMVFCEHYAYVDVTNSLIRNALVVRGHLSGESSRSNLTSKDVDLSTEFVAGGILVTTKMYERGYNNKNVAVVINLSMASHTKQFQRAGRALRLADGKTKAWFYDLHVQAHQVQIHKKYETFYNEGYAGDIHHVSSADFCKRADDHLLRAKVQIPFAYDKIEVYLWHVLAMNRYCAEGHQQALKIEDDATNSAEASGSSASASASSSQTKKNNNIKAKNLRKILNGVLNRTGHQQLAHIQNKEFKKKEAEQKRLQRQQASSSSSSKLAAKRPRGPSSCIDEKMMIQTFLGRALSFEDLSKIATNFLKEASTARANVAAQTVAEFVSDEAGNLVSDMCSFFYDN